MPVTGGVQPPLNPNLTGGLPLHAQASPTPSWRRATRLPPRAMLRLPPATQRQRPSSPACAQARRSTPRQVCATSLFLHPPCFLEWPLMMHLVIFITCIFISPGGWIDAIYASIHSLARAFLRDFAPVRFRTTVLIVPALQCPALKAVSATFSVPSSSCGALSAAPSCGPTMRRSASQPASDAKGDAARLALCCEAAQAGGYL